MCGVCGSKMSTHGIYDKDENCNITYYCSYICSQKKYNKCDSSRISHTKVDKAFRDYIEHIKTFDVENEIDVNKPLDNEVDPKALKIEYENALAKLLQKEKDIMTHYINDTLNFDEYNKMLEMIRIAKTDYEDKINELEETKIANIKLQKEDIVTNFKENWDLLTKIERLQFLQTYIKSIYIAKEPEKDNPAKKLVKVKKVEFYQH